MKNFIFVTSGYITVTFISMFIFLSWAGGADSLSQAVTMIF